MPAQLVSTPAGARYILGWVEYVKQLTPEQVWQWELIPMSMGEWKAYNIYLERRDA